MAAQPPKTTPLNIPPISLEEEDSLIHARVTNEERPLRRLLKKYHTFTSLARSSGLPPSSGDGMTVEDARQAFLIELSSFQLLMQKNVLMQDAEARQVVEYELERERIEKKHEETRQEIINLKKALEDAQLFRRRKIEYDVLAEKINTFPTRAELNDTISSLEGDIESIEEEQKATKQAMETRRTVFDTLVRELNLLRLMGRDGGTPIPSRSLTPAFLDADPGTPMPIDDVVASPRLHPRDLLHPRAGSTATAGSSSSTLNPHARTFEPTSSGLSNVVRVKVEAEDEREEGEERESRSRDDVEMGELPYERSSSPPDMDDGGRGKRRREEREEGEASDGSSVLSDVPE